MMGEEKFASLSSGLLARKGAAKPAMRRQGFINPDGDVTEDLGWNDMGLETPHPINGDGDYHGEAPLPEVRKQQEQLADGLNGTDHAPFDVADAPAVAAFDVEAEEYEPYKPNGHGGLSPMGSSDDEAELVDDLYEQVEAEQTAMPADETGENELEEGVRAHGQSPLSVKNVERDEPSEQAQQQIQAEPVVDAVPAREKVAFTLRLDRERHLKLRLASAVTNRSAQRLVTEALDQFLKQHPDVQALTGPMSGVNKH